MHVRARVALRLCAGSICRSPLSARMTHRQAMMASCVRVHRWRPEPKASALAAGRAMLRLPPACAPKARRWERHVAGEGRRHYPCARSTAPLLRSVGKIRSRKCAFCHPHAGQHQPVAGQPPPVCHQVVSWGAASARGRRMERSSWRPKRAPRPAHSDVRGLPWISEARGVFVFRQLCGFLRDLAFVCSALLRLVPGFRGPGRAAITRCC